MSGVCLRRHISATRPPSRRTSVSLKAKVERVDANSTRSSQIDQRHVGAEIDTATAHRRANSPVRHSSENPPGCCGYFDLLPI